MKVPLRIEPFLTGSTSAFLCEDENAAFCFRRGDFVGVGVAPDTYGRLDAHPAPCSRALARSPTGRFVSIAGIDTYYEH